MKPVTALIRGEGLAFVVARVGVPVGAVDFDQQPVGQQEIVNVRTQRELPSVVEPGRLEQLR